MIITTLPREDAHSRRPPRTGSGGPSLQHRPSPGSRKPSAVVFSTTRRWASVRYGRRVSSSTSAPFGTTAGALVGADQREAVGHAAQVVGLVGGVVGKAVVGAGCPNGRSRGRCRPWCRSAPSGSLCACVTAARLGGGRGRVDQVGGDDGLRLHAAADHVERRMHAGHDAAFAQLEAAADHFLVALRQRVGHARARRAPLRPSGRW